MNHSADVPIQRCCPTHRDWVSLAGHLISDYSHVPCRVVVAELRQAQHAAAFFGLESADALDCAELMVRYRFLVATSQQPSSAPRTPTSVTRVA
jgi:hypothetical protein